MLEGQRSELTDSLVDGFKENGRDVLVVSQDAIWDFEGLDFIVTYGPMQSMVRVIQRLTSMGRVPPLFIWFTEQVPPPHFSTIATNLAARFRYSFECSLCCLGSHIGRALLRSNRGGRLLALGELIELKRRNLKSLIGVFTDTNRIFLQRHGLSGKLIPMGYHPSFGRDLRLDRDLDVVFIGSTRDRRRRQLISDLQERFWKKGITFVIKDGSPEHGSVWGKERARLLNRTKIMLNIARQPWDDPVFRLLLTAPNKALLLSENLLATSTGPFHSGEHFAMAPLEELVDVTEYYLKSEKERRRITNQAYEFVTTKLTMAKMAQKAIHALGFS